MPEHTVWRHGGARSHCWRRLFTGRPLEALNRWFDVYRYLRQGAVMVLPVGVDPTSWAYGDPTEEQMKLVVCGDNAALPEWARSKGAVRRLYGSSPLLRTRW